MLTLYSLALLVIATSVSGTDGRLFNISSDGVLTSPDYEDPTNKDKNNVYQLQVRVSDGKAADGSADAAVDAALHVTVRVTDEDDGGNRAAQFPAQPSGFAATAGNGSATLSWDNPNDDRIILYQYRYGDEESFRDTRWADIPSSGAATVSFNVTGLDNGTTYKFRIRAKNSTGFGPSSAIASATPSATP